MPGKSGSSVRLNVHLESFLLFVQYRFATFFFWIVYHVNTAHSSDHTGSGVAAGSDVQ